ncbi:MAG: methyltransferase domain-containing protein [Bacteroidota bacterium]
MKKKKSRPQNKRLKANRVPAAPPSAPAFNILDVGCGRRKRAGSIGIDINPRSQADVIHDLNRFPYPFPDSHFDEIICDNTIEHLDDFLMVMEELHRIAKPLALVTVVVPFFSHQQAHTDPTHRHFFGVHSFDYFIDGTPNGGFQYSNAKYELLSVEFEKGLAQRHWFDRAIVAFANARKDTYENRLANVFPLRNLTFVLRVVK